MLKLLMKCTDEKNISLAVMGYKIFFSSTTLTLKSKPTEGLTIKRKPVVGLTTKNCQLISGRYNISLLRQCKTQDSNMQRTTKQTLAVF